MIPVRPIAACLKHKNLNIAARQGCGKGKAHGTGADDAYVRQTVRERAYAKGDVHWVNLRDVLCGVDTIGIE